MSNTDPQIRGIEQKQEVQPKTLWRDVRNYRQRFSDLMEKPEGFLMILILTLSVLLVMPFMTEIVVVITLWLLRYTKNKKFSLPFRIPLSAKLPDPKDPKAGGNLPGPSAGITFFGNERESKKELWFKNDDMRTHVLIFGSTGAGKALKENELIHTPHGWKLNKNIKVGDLVSTPSGQSEVIGVYPQGELELHRIYFSDGRTIDVSGDHLWEVSSKKINDSILVNGKTIHNTKVINTLELKKLLELDDEVYIPTSKEVEKPALDFDLNPYLLGAFFTNSPIYIEDFKKVFNNHPVKKIFGEKLDDKEKLNIPKQYLNGSIEQRYMFINGYLDLKGKVDENSILVNDIKNEQFALDLVEMLQSLGAIVTLYEKDDFINDERIGKSINLVIDHHNIKKLFGSEMRKEEFGDFLTNKELKLKVLSVNKLNKKEACQCIKIKDTRGLFITKDYIVTHNTETLLSLAFNALVQGSGLIYVDGKGDTSLFVKIFAMARVMGREDDLLVINYMTGSRDVFGPQSEKLSNTLNPFSSGSSGGLTELLISLMDDGGSEGGMWKGRAISLVSAIMMALVYMRDTKEILLDVDVIREYLILDNIIKLYKTRRDLPSHIKQALRAYLLSLPGFQENANKQTDTALEQHGYLQMQFTKLLGSLSDAYGYIFRTNLGEVDFKDIVLNRRILVVLLPALEKSTDELANLGKIIVACLKQMMAEGLGSKLEGDFADVIETKPTNAATPFMCILDEYGYYAVKGSAVMPAQARSLGFSMIFAGQDLPAFEKASKEEAASIVANCNIKMFMKLEDPKDTFELFEKSVGEAYVTHVSGYQSNSGGLVTSYQGLQNANVELRKRGNLLDLKDQREGEAHIIFKSAVIRAKMFYASPPNPRTIQVNYFIKVEPPDTKEIQQMDSGLREFSNKLNDKTHIREVEEILEDEDDYVKDIRRLLDSYSSLAPTEIACAVIAQLGGKMQNVLDENISSIKEIYNSKDTTNYKSKIDIFSEEDEDNDEDEDDEEDEDEDNDDINVFLDEDKTRRNIEEIEKMSGSSESNARRHAERFNNDMRAATEYPSTGAPEEKEPEEILDMLKELDESIGINDDDE